MSSTGYLSQMRRFNISGPCDPADHYMVPAESRIPELEPLLANKAYFVVHAPRQSGKTTAMRALASRLTREGRYAALHFSCEAARAFSDNVSAAEHRIWLAIQAGAEQRLPEALRPPALQDAPAGGLLTVQLKLWAERCPRPLVLIFDEIDALEGNALKSVLSQLRESFPERPHRFPSTVILCGMKDVRDYKFASGGGPVSAGSSSPFNIKEKSLRLPSFTETELHDLYAQHTADTGQIFTKEALARAWYYTEGQPWLTNALAREVVEEIRVPPTEPITEGHIEEARERLILARATHIDSLLARLSEDRVRRVLEPLIGGGFVLGGTSDEDVEYLRDLGLLARTMPLRIANPIYREVIVRVLAQTAEQNLPELRGRYTLADGRLDMGALLADFLDFWRQHGDLLADGMPYHEVAPHLVLMGWLQKVVNGSKGPVDPSTGVRGAGAPVPEGDAYPGGGRLEREVGVGRGRVDLLLAWPIRRPGEPVQWQREVVEIKVWRDRRPDPLAEGLAQIDEYLARLGLGEGTLALFDRRAGAEPLPERATLESAQSPGGRAIRVLRG